MWPRKEIPVDCPEPVAMAALQCSRSLFERSVAPSRDILYHWLLWLLVCVMLLLGSRDNATADLFRGGYMTTLTITHSWTHSETIQTRVKLSSDDLLERNITPPPAPRSSRVSTLSPMLRGIAATTPDSTDNRR